MKYEIIKKSINEDYLQSHKIFQDSYFACYTILKHDNEMIIIQTDWQNNLSSSYANTLD